jgi:sensor domain CHASE-containing protein
LQCLQDGCIGSYRFEVAMSLVLLFVNPLEENEAALDIDSE